MLERINQILLPQQTKELVATLKQRAVAKQLNCEGFEVVRVVGKSLGMSVEDYKEFNERMTQLESEFSETKQRLIDDSCLRLSAKFPEGFHQKIVELIAFSEKKYQGIQKAEVVDFQSLESWTDDDFQKYEERYFQMLVSHLVTNPEMRVEIGVLDFQIDQMVKINEKRQQPPKQRSPAEIQKLNKLMEDGNVEELKKLHKLEKDAEIERRGAYIQEIVKTVLLDEQVEKLRNVARFQRYMWESKYGDHFGAILAWLKSYGEELEVDGIENLVQDERTKFYEGLTKHRQTFNEKAFGSPPKAAKQKFLDEFGRVYDYQSEKISNWDELRKRSPDN